MCVGGPTSDSAITGLRGRAVEGQRRALPGRTGAADALIDELAPEVTLRFLDRLDSLPDMVVCSMETLKNHLSLIDGDPGWALVPHGANHREALQASTTFNARRSVSYSSRHPAQTDRC